MTKPRKYGNDYPDDFTPTWTWERAWAAQTEREKRQREPIERHGSYQIMNGWQRLIHISVKKHWVPYWRRKNP